MLEQWQKTPMDLGLPMAELDPAWDSAMFILKAAFENQRRLDLPTR